MKIWLDDERPEPNGWERAYWPSEVINMMKGNQRVEVISLDHDLGDDSRGTGYDVLLWIERQVHTNSKFVLPEIRIHTANVSARHKMESALTSIKRYYGVLKGEGI